MATATTLLVPKRQLKRKIGMAGFMAALVLASVNYWTQPKVQPLAIEPYMQAGQVKQASFVAQYNADYFLEVHSWNGNQEDIRASITPDTDSGAPFEVKNGAAIIKSKALTYTISCSDPEEIQPTDGGGDSGVEHWDQFAAISARKHQVYTVSITALRTLKANGSKAPTLDIALGANTVQTLGENYFLIYFLAVCLGLLSLVWIVPSD